MRYNFSPGVTELISGDTSRGDVAVISLHGVICRGTLISHCSNNLQCVQPQGSCECVRRQMRVLQFCPGKYQRSLGESGYSHTPQEENFQGSMEVYPKSTSCPNQPRTSGCWMGAVCPLSVQRILDIDCGCLFLLSLETECRGRSACGSKYWISGPWFLLVCHA